MEIRPVRPEEHDTLAELTVEAYRPFGVTDDGYDEELADVATRAEEAVVLVAVDDDGTVLGGVTYVPPDEDPTSVPLHEHDEPGAASIRALAVGEHARRRGIGAELSSACMDRAAADGARQIILHSSARMIGAHRLYAGLGFERAPELDWAPAPGIELLGFRYDLSRR